MRMARTVNYVSPITTICELRGMPKTLLERKSTAK
jgi:hypothetical protein